MLIDSHAHLMEAGLERFEPQGSLDAVVVSAYNAQNIEKTLQLAAGNPKLFATIGIHPQFCKDYNDEIEHVMRSSCAQIVGIGEIGLDNNYSTDFALQKRVFVRQLELAGELGLPVVVHARGCYAEVLDILRDFNGLNFMLHAFNGAQSDCAKALDLGGYISFAGNITYKRHVDLRKTAASVPLSRLLIETDSPNALPSVFMRKGVNTPNNVGYVASAIADARGVSVDEIAGATRQNAIKLFNLDIKEG